MIDEGSGSVYARETGKKGTVEMDWHIEDMSEELKSWGHPGGSTSKLILKSDNEPAIVALRGKLGKYHGGAMIPEGSSVGESQSNGRVEEAGKTVREYAKVYKDKIEFAIKEKIPGDAAIMQWMVRWAAMVRSRHKVRKGGETPCERLKGRKCNMVAMPFGESVWYKQLKDKEERAGNRMESEWQEGVWLGHALSTSDSITEQEQES